MTGCTEECRQMLPLISEYLDQELPPDMSLVVGDHLATCAPCREFAEGLRRSIALAHAFTPCAPPGPISRQAHTELEKAWRRMLASKKAAGCGG